MIELLLLVLLSVVGVVAFIAYRNAQDFSDANEVVPGVPTRAPQSWAGGHNPEARLHRRLRDAMTSLREVTSNDQPTLADVRATLEREALAVDDVLVAVASLPKAQREGRLQKVTDAVEAIETAVADVVVVTGPALDDVHRSLDDVRTRLTLVAEARAELADLDVSAESLEHLRARLEGEEGDGGGEAASPPS